jgi:hypothetical protein
VLGVASARAFVPELDSWIDVIRTVAYLLTAYVVWQRVYLLLRYQTDWFGDEKQKRTLRDERADAHGVLADARDTRAHEREERANAREIRADERERHTGGTPPTGVTTPRE